MKPIYKLYIYGLLLLNVIFSVLVFTTNVRVPYLGSMAGIIVAVINISGIIVFRWLNERNK